MLKKVTNPEGRFWKRALTPGKFHFKDINGCKQRKWSFVDRVNREAGWRFFILAEVITEQYTLNTLCPCLWFRGIYLSLIHGVVTNVDNWSRVGLGRPDGDKQTEI